MSEPTPGQTSICYKCGQPIVYVAPFWEHIGLRMPHIATQPKPARQSDFRPDETYFASYAEDTRE